ncbi:MAG: hypothetical protein ACYC4J_03880 [Gemmatimonadaceae bacterium]
MQATVRVCDGGGVQDALTASTTVVTGDHAPRLSCTRSAIVFAPWENFTEKLAWPPPKAAPFTVHS